MNDCVFVSGVVHPPKDTMLFKARPRARIRISMFSLMIRCIETKWDLDAWNDKVGFI